MDISIENDVYKFLVALPIKQIYVWCNSKNNNTQRITKTFLAVEDEILFLYVGISERRSIIRERSMC